MDQFESIGTVFKLDKKSSTWSKISNGRLIFKYHKQSYWSLKLTINCEKQSSNKDTYNLKHKIHVIENYSIILSGCNDIKQTQHTLSINFRSPNDAETCINWLKQKVKQIHYTNDNNISAPSPSLLFTSQSNNNTNRVKQTTNKNKIKQQVTSRKTAVKSYSHKTHKKKLLKSRKRISRYRAQFYDREAAEFDIKEHIIIILVYILVIIIPIFWFFCFKTIKQFEMGVVLRLGKIRGSALKCGIYVILPFIDDLRIIDMRVQTIKLKKTSILCADGITIKMKGIIYTKVINPWPVGMGGGNCNGWFRNLAYPILRDVIGKYVLMDLLESREEINNSLNYLFQKETYKYGVDVCNFEIQNILVPKKLQRAIASTAESERSKYATIISAIAEVECAQNLNDAAKKMSASNNALLLRYLHTMNKIGKENATTIYFPFPMHFNLFDDLKKKKNNEITIINGVMWCVR
eukprot:474284_1